MAFENTAKQYAATRQLLRQLRFAMQEAEQKLNMMARMGAVLAAAKLIPWEAWEEAIAGHRSREFAREFVERYTKGAQKDDAILAAMKKAYPRSVKRKNGNRGKEETLMKMGYANLERPDVCAAIEAMYAEIGFTPQEAAALHVEHIKGLTREEVVRDKNGNVVVDGDNLPVKVLVTDKPSYQALKDFEMWVTPKQPSKFESHVSGGIRLFAGGNQLKPVNGAAQKAIEGETDASVE